MDLLSTLYSLHCNQFLTCLHDLHSKKCTFLYKTTQFQAIMRSFLLKALTKNIHGILSHLWVSNQGDTWHHIPVQFKFKLDL